MSAQEVVGPLPAIAFRDGTRVVYDPPRDSMDPRYAACTVHRVACDCREAALSETRREYLLELTSLRVAATTALAGHQVNYPLWLSDDERRAFRGLCLCSGCVINRATHGGLLPPGDVDLQTGRVRPIEGTHRG